jgi:hypothetical protein
MARKTIINFKQIHDFMMYYSQSKFCFTLANATNTHKVVVLVVVKNVNMLVMNKKWAYEGSNDNPLGFSIG